MHQSLGLVQDVCGTARTSNGVSNSSSPVTAPSPNLMDFARRGALSEIEKAYGEVGVSKAHAFIWNESVNWKRNYPSPTTESVDSATAVGSALLLSASVGGGLVSQTDTSAVDCWRSSCIAPCKSNPCGGLFAAVVRSSYTTGVLQSLRRLCVQIWNANSGKRSRPVFAGSKLGGGGSNNTRTFARCEPW